MKFSETTLKYWQEEDWKDLQKAESVEDLYKIAKQVLERMPQPLGQVCSPVNSSGGLGSVEANLEYFNNTIIGLQKRGLNIFDQMPFEEQMQNIKRKLSVDKIYGNIMNDFYSPIFKSGLVSTFYFTPNWQTSRGAKMEHEKIEELGIEIVYL